MIVDSEEGQEAHSAQLAELPCCGTIAPVIRKALPLDSRSLTLANLLSGSPYYFVQLKTESN